MTLTEPVPNGNNIMDLIYNAEWTEELAGRIGMTDDTIAVQ